MTNNPPIYQPGQLPKVLYGEACPWAKLTVEQVLEIRGRYAAGWSRVALAAEYGVARKTIWEIVNGKTWAWL